MRFSAAALILFVTALIAVAPATPLQNTTAFDTICGTDALPTPGVQKFDDNAYRQVVVDRIAACHKKIVDMHAPSLAAEAQYCAPAPGWTLENRYEIYEKLYVCSKFVSDAAATALPIPTPTALFRAARRTLYVYTTSAAPTVAGIDNPNTLLIWAVANQIQQDFFANTDVAVVPEPGWSASDFTNQCEADPYDKDHSRGTLGAIGLTGATVSSGSDFYLVVSKGWTHTDFTADLFDCTQPEPRINLAPVLRGAYNAVGQSYRTYVPLEPLATLGLFVSTLNSNSTNKSEGLLGSAAVLALATTVPQLSTFNVGTSTVPTVSVPRAYVDSAQNLSMNLVTSFCRNTIKDRFVQAFCGDDGGPKVTARWRAGWPPAPCEKQGESDSVGTRLACNDPPSPIPTASSRP